MELPDIKPDARLPREGAKAPINKIVGRRIKRMRELNGRSFSQEILGKKIGISKAQMWNIETGRSDISLSRLETIAAALKVPMAVLLPDDQQARTG